MRHIVIRTSFGPNVRERHDFSVALHAPDGELVAIYQDNPPHIVPTVYAVLATRDRFGDDIAPGDVVIVNDPYVLGGHMNDVAHLYPIFEDRRLVFWIVIRLHYIDVGGMSPGSITPDSREVFQEGLRIPPVKAYVGGKPNDSFLDVLFANVRLAEERKADVMSLIASFWTGEKRLREIFVRHGIESVIRCGELIRDRDEQHMRQAISRLTPGEYAYEVDLDSDGAVARWVPIRVRVTVGSDSLTADFTESADAVVGPMNGAASTAACAAYVAIKGLVDPSPIVSGGSFRPIRIVTRPGSLFRAAPPAPTSGAQDLMHRATAAILGALAGADPSRGVGDHCSPAHHYMAGHDHARKRSFIMYDSPIGGTGAVNGQDGSDVVAGFERGDHARVMSIEAHEGEFPFRAEYNQLRRDSGGAGKWRGGLGLRRCWKVVEGSGTVTDMAEPSFTPYFGLLGAHGGPGSTTVVVHRGERSVPATGIGKVVRFPIESGDLVEILKWGAGGYGDPLERDPALVLEDVREGRVSEQAAFASYGVVLGPQGIDIPASLERRREVRAGRVFVPFSVTSVDSQQGDTRLWLISPSLAQRLQVAEGDVVECLGKAPAPLRGRAAISQGEGAESVPIGPFARACLRVQVGDLVELRKTTNLLADLL
jgi:N-methylhydantoinase B